MNLFPRGLSHTLRMLAIYQALLRARRNGFLSNAALELWKKLEAGHGITRRLWSVTQAALPDSTALAYSYDAAHRLVGVTDTKGNTVTYTLDNMGNRVGEQIKDPQGNLQRDITRVYDALNRVQQLPGAEK